MIYSQLNLNTNRFNETRTAMPVAVLVCYSKNVKSVIS